MKQVERAFLRVYRQRSRTILYILFPVIFFAAMQIAMYTDQMAREMIFAAAICLGLLILRWILLPGYARKEIHRAIHDPAQEQWFLDTIDREMPDAVSIQEKDTPLYFFKTRTWLLVITPNGCLICPREEVSSVDRIIVPTSKNLRLQIRLRDGSEHIFPYERLWETLFQFLETDKTQGGTSE